MSAKCRQLRYCQRILFSDPYKYQVNEKKKEFEGVQPFYIFKFDSFRNPPPCAHRIRVKVMPHSPPKTVLIVVNVLPLVFERNVSSSSGWDVSWATGATAMLYRTLVRDADKYSPLYIGCPEVFVAKSEEAALEKQLLALRCVPVFLDPPVAHRYFQGFCKGVLWPVFHNVVDVYNSAELQLDCEEQEAKGKFLWFGEKKEESSGIKSAWCDPVSWNPAAQDMCWSDYCSVNRTFARRVVESYHTGDLVWLHDFHFLMLPSYLLRRLRTALVTMYLHVPFPSSEIFRCLAMRTEILRAMLCADHIGFLVFEHARHFLTSCKRLLGLDYKTCPNGMLVIEYNGRKIHISCSHVEPDVTHLHEMLDQNVADVNGAALDFAADVKNAITAGRDPDQRRIVIGSVDRLEGLTAIPLKLRAFDRFLATHPEKRGSVVLVQIGITLDSRPNDYHRTRDNVLKFTEEINRRYAPPGGVVVYFEEKRKTTCAERVILWRMCDIYLDTCVRGGLSLLPFEYMIAQHRNIQSKSRHSTGWSSPRGNLDVSGLDRSFGLMIVSEFSAYSRILSGSLAVNPWKTDDMVAAFAKACGMSYYEKHNRFYMNYKFLVGRSDSTPWGERLLGDVEAVTEKLEDATSGEVVQVGFGFDFRVMRFESGFVCLDVDDLVKKCSKTSRRLFIFDYGGSLSSTASILDEEGAQYSHRAGCVEQSTQKFDASDRSGADCTGQSAARYIDGKVRKPISDETRANLQTLCGDPCNIVFVISNTQRGALEDQFGSITNLNLVAENGLFIKIGNREQWECVCDEDKRNFDWKDDVKRVMQAYAARTNGSFLVENAASLLYDYRNSDQEYGEIQSLELCAQLAKIVERGDAIVNRAKGYVEVHQYGVSKAVAVSLILKVLKDRIDIPEFAFIVGDDESDEKMFQAVQAFAENEPQLEHVVTCTVGKKPSSAKYYVDNMSDILTALHAIATRLRLTHSRSRLFQQPRTYCRQFLKQKTLVSKEFLQSLSREMRSSSMLSNGSTTMTSGQDTEEIFLPSVSEAPPTNWAALGAAVVAGCIVGALAASQRHRVLQQLQRRHFP
ncbi:trehalose-phosphatase [Phytophthora nicotianae]|uniref:Trehalose-phosphatase n=2 Tax=Phytophthora nicotianae TaxID=4792 RepID=V9E576_PHYNI|nr:trehalose-phosphatase [Phytophthora nicotianae P1569]ETM34490.1 trehalose-phosphatase [Phytophthora nicotianae]